MSKYTRKPRYATNDVYNATEGAYNVVEPSEAKKDLGHDYKEKPPRQYFNWLARQGHQWLDYLDDEINQFAAHAADPIDLTVIIDSGRVDDGDLVTVATQTTAAFVAPSAGNSRIDRIVIDPETGAHTVVAGTEDPSPVAPAIPSGKLPNCQILLTDSTAAITDDDITDERIIFDSLTRGGTITGNVTLAGDLLINTTHFFVEYSTGKVGIGTATPSAGVDIAAVTRITGITSIPTAGAGLELFYNAAGTSGRIQGYNRTGSAYIGVDIRGNPVTINSSNEGKVGINAASPDAGLDVGTTLRIADNSNVPTAGEGVEIQYNLSTNIGYILAYDRTGAAYKDLRLEGNNVCINGGSGTENYTVGVGTNSPKPLSSSYSAMQIGHSSFLMAQEGSAAGGSASLWLAGNMYHDGAWKAQATGGSSYISIAESIAFITAASVAEDASTTNSTRMVIYNDGGVIIGGPTGGNKGTGTLNAAAAIYVDGVRNTRTVPLSTPELITSTPTVGAWTTVNNATLNAAAAIAAIIKIASFVQVSTAGTTGYNNAYLRTTGTALGFTTQTQVIWCGETKDTGDTTTPHTGYDCNTTIVALDSNYDFDYYVNQGGGSGYGTDIYLIGYIINL